MKGVFLSLFWLLKSGDVWFFFFFFGGEDVVWVSGDGCGLGEGDLGDGEGCGSVATNLAKISGRKNYQRSHEPVR